MALVIGETLTSHFWLNILPLAQNPRLRLFVTEQDLIALGPRLHIRPLVVPCFLVFANGYVIDWFPNQSSLSFSS